MISDIMHFKKEAHKKGIAIFLDFKNAFDSIEWNYMNVTLNAFNFGPQILKWVNIFYNDVSSCVINNGHTSSFFFLECVVRQGCPLSGILLF